MHVKTNICLVIFPLWILLYYFKEKVSYYLVFKFLQMPYESQIANSLWFFLSTLLKITLLLLLIIFLMGIVRSFFSPEKTRNALEGKPLFVGNVLASTFGIITPFCSCSAIPLFIGFVESGIPLGVTFSFLIAAPLINEVGVIMLVGMFGWKIGFIYIVTGLFIAISCGWAIGKLRLEKWVQDWVFTTKFGSEVVSGPKLTLEHRVDLGIQAVRDIFSKIWIYVILGVAIGALIHGYVPENYLVSVMHKSTWYSVPLSVLIGIPIYSCTAGIIPITTALIEKGVPLGTALAFMMSVIGISLPELIILKKVLKMPFILTFVGILALGITLLGYFFNIIMVQ